MERELRVHISNSKDHTTECGLSPYPQFKGPRKGVWVEDPYTQLKGPRNSGSVCPTQRAMQHNVG